MANRRRSFLAGAGSAAASVLAGCLSALGEERTGNRSVGNGSRPGYEVPTTPVSVATSYPQYQYDAGNTGHVPDVDGPTGAVAPLFEFGPAAVGTDRQVGSPAVADGTVYLTTGQGTETATAETTVHAVDAVEGTGQWATTYANTNGPGQTAVVGGRVVAGVGGRLVGLDAATGEQAWAFDGAFASGFTVSGETVYAVGLDGGTPTAYALATDDGSVRWRRPVDAGRFRPTPAVGDGTVYVGGDALQALDAATGAEQWRIERPVSAPPTVVEGDVVVGAEDRLGRYGTADGAERWETAIAGGTVDHSPAATEDHLYVVTDGALVAYDPESGERDYSVTVDVSGPPVVAGDHLYCCGADQLTCLDTDGTITWAYGTQGVAGSGVAPAVVDGVAYFPAERLYAIAG